MVCAFTLEIRELFPQQFHALVHCGDGAPLLLLHIN